MGHMEIEIVVALVAGLLSGIFSEIVGAGALVSLPMLISVGLPPVIANGTNRIGTMALYTAAYFSYRDHKSVDVRSAWIYAIPVVAGTIFGSLVAVHLSDNVMQWLIIGLIAAMALFNSLTPSLENRVGATEKPLTRLNVFNIILLFVAGIYCGLIAQVMSYLMYFIMVRWMMVDKDVAQGLKFFLAMIVTPFALSIFIIYGRIDWLVGLFLFIGASYGGFLGERILTVMKHKSTNHLIILSLALSLLYLFVFMLKHYSDGVDII